MGFDCRYDERPAKDEWLTYRKLAIILNSVPSFQKKEKTRLSLIMGNDWDDELFFEDNSQYDFKNINDIEDIKPILEVYMNKYYDINDDNSSWFNKMKLLCDELGYASDMKEYKANPEAYKGSVADISMVIRVAVTKKSMTPDLHSIMHLLGVEKLNKRFNIFLNK
jgi:glutamyl/glutaminyl-tRNA synthetase